MYLSCLLINVGENPDRPRPGRLWLRNLYHVHQRLCMAFPSADRISDDADFLKPFNQKDFNQQVHLKRDSGSGFLFRIDPHTGGRAVILVQSAVSPDWEYAFHNAGYFLAAPSEVKSLNPSFTNGQRLRFRLLANPTRRLSRNSPDIKKKEDIGKRVPVPNEQLFDWLARKAERSGFSINRDSTIIQPGYIYMKKPQNGKGQRLFSVHYEGVLEVSDADNFHKTLIRGIGSGKAFGFGLLSVARADYA